MSGQNWSHQIKTVRVSLSAARFFSETYVYLYIPVCCCQIGFLIGQSSIYFFQYQLGHQLYSAHVHTYRRTASVRLDPYVPLDEENCYRLRRYSTRQLFCFAFWDRFLFVLSGSCHASTWLQESF